MLTLSPTQVIVAVLSMVKVSVREEITFVENLLYDNSFPRPPEESNSEYSDATIESLFPSHIPVEDSDSLMEEIDVFLASDGIDAIGIEIRRVYDSDKGLFVFLKDLLSK
ncbi:hypothetical protein Tco_0019863 [Tanacetum coccineum]